MPKSEQSLNDILYDVKRIEEHRETLTESKIRKIYKQLMKELNGFIGEEYVKHANDQGVLAFSSLSDRSRQARFLEEVVARVDSITPELKSEIMGLVDTTYTNCYKGMARAVTTASNTEELASAMSGSLVKPEVLKQSLDNNVSKLTLPNVLEKHRQEIVYNIKQELTIGLVNGDRYEKMAKRLTDKLDISYGKATRIVRTESHRNIESGFFDCAESIAQSVDGSGLVYVAIWRTMKDDRVRPNVRRKTKKGWKTYRSKNGADHASMEGKTIRVGDFFVFSDGVKTKCPSKSGEARHDCNCRCFLEYDVMTEEEFAKVNANKTEKTEAVTNKVDNVEAQDLTERRRQRLAEKPKVDINKQGESVLRENYKEIKEQNNLHWVDTKDAKITVDYGNLDVRFSSAYNNTTAELLREYNAPIQKIELMDKETAFFRKDTFISTNLNYETYSSTVQLNGLKLGDYDKYIERIKKNMESGYAVSVPDGLIEQYLPTHEFAHSVLTMGNKVPTTRNWAQMDYTATRKARKEVETLFSEYTTELEQAKSKIDLMYKKVFEGTATDEEWAVLRECEQKYNSTLISRYSLENADEFYAEAFTQAKLSESVSPYAKKVLAITDKYFKK